MKYLGLVVLFLSLSVSAFSEQWPVDFYYDLEQQELSIASSNKVIEGKRGMLVIYRNGISVLKEKDFDFQEIYNKPMHLKARKNELLRIEVWGEKGLEYSEEITAGENVINTPVKKVTAPEKKKSILVSDEDGNKGSVLIGEDVIDNFIEQKQDVLIPSYGYKENNSRGPDERGYGYKLDENKYEGEGSYGYQLNDKEYEPFGYTDYGHESKDGTYGREDY